MAAAAMRSEQQSESQADHESYVTRELRATRVAARQGLDLRRSGIDCGVESSNRYDLLYRRYDQPVGVNLKLEDVEAWLGIPII